MSYIQVKDSEYTHGDCYECCFYENCFGGCRAKHGYHWEEIQ